MSFLTSLLIFLRFVITLGAATTISAVCFEIWKESKLYGAALNAFSEWSRERKLNREIAHNPERIAHLVGFLVPRLVRAKCYEPFLEDLKADRAERIARTGSPRVRRWIEFCFYFRLAVTVLQSLVCYLGDLVAKIAPFIRALFFKGG